MADAWGGSWGTSWGNSWGAGAVAAATSSGVRRLRHSKPLTPQERDQAARRAGQRVYYVPPEAPLAPTQNEEKIAEAMQPPRGELVTLDELARLMVDAQEADDEEAILAILMAVD